MSVVVGDVGGKRTAINLAAGHDPPGTYDWHYWTLLALLARLGLRARALPQEHK